jgi:hypothetical protein
MIIISGMAPFRFTNKAAHKEKARDWLYLASLSRMRESNEQVGYK